MTIPKMKEREEAARLWAAQRTARNALEAAIDIERDIFDTRLSALDAECDARREAILREQDAANGVGDLRTKLIVADEAYQAHPDRVMIAWDDDVMRCAKSGVPILYDDEVIEDGETGEMFLRAALGLPPRPEEPEADDAIEEAA